MNRFATSGILTSSTTEFLKPIEGNGLKKAINNASNRKLLKKLLIELKSLSNPDLFRCVGDDVFLDDCREIESNIAEMRKLHSLTQMKEMAINEMEKIQYISMNIASHPLKVVVITSGVESLRSSDGWKYILEKDSNDQLLSEINLCVKNMISLSSEVRKAEDKLTSFYEQLSPISKAESVVTVERLTVIYSCTEQCSEDSDVEFTFPANEILRDLSEKCPVCEKGYFVLDVEKTWKEKNISLECKLSNF